MSNARALPPPHEPVVVITQALAERALEASRESARRRMILPFHKSDDARLHRMFNALQPGTYVQPHRHLRAPKSEVFVALRGRADCLIFDDDGQIVMAPQIEAGGAQFGIDIAAGHWHSFLVRTPDTLLYEVKEGPYTSVDDKDFAPWAPPEGSPEVPSYVASLEAALARFRAAGSHGAR
jgi:cupin fold WbuC family metalloprotein